MSFLKSLYTVLELESSEEEAEQPSKRARCEEPEASASPSHGASTSASPLFLNKLEESEDHSGLMDSEEGRRVAGFHGFM